MSLGKELTLSDGLRIPSVGFGTWRIKGGEYTAGACRAAVKAGYRLLDTAWLYQNLDGVGLGVRSCGVPRDELVITDKLFPTMLGYDSAIAACKADLAESKLSHFDLYLIHWPISKDHKEDWEKILEDTWGAMTELKRQGLVRSIGVSNFHQRHLDVIAHFPEQPSLNQIECHPGFPNEGVVELCKARNIAPQAWRPLMKGDLDQPELLALAEKHGKTPAQVCLRWNLERGVCLLAKSTRPERIKENLDLFGFALSDEDMQSLAPLARIGRFGAHPDDAPY